MNAGFPPPCAANPPPVYVANTRVDLTCRADVLAQLRTALGEQGALQVVHTLNPEICMNAYRNPAYLATLNKGDLNVVDGVGLQRAVQAATSRDVDRICGSDLIYDLAELAQAAHRSLYVLGGAPDRLDKAKSALGKLYPDLKIHGFAPGFSTALPLLEQDEIMTDLRKKHPGVLAVCLGAPRQEMWIAQNRALLQQCGVSIAAGLGGTVDFLSGDVRRAPKWMRKSGLEWAFRLMQNPRRLRRQISALPEFALRVRFDPNFVSLADTNAPSEGRQ